MNYNKEMENILMELKKANKVPRLLLHSCCAPCSSHVISVLTEYFDITILYYNPNIEPFDEYEKRKQEEIRFINEFPNINKLDIIDCDYDNDLFKEMSKGLEDAKECGPRCIKCYHLRLNKTAEIASHLKYDYFATTLTVSPLKNSEKLNQIGLLLQDVYKVKYLVSDFKKKEGYKHSIELAKEYDLYRQDYCGCIYSKQQREQEKANKNIEK